MGLVKVQSIGAISAGRTSVEKADWLPRSQRKAKPVKSLQLAEILCEKKHEFWLRLIDTSHKTPLQCPLHYGSGPARSVRQRCIFRSPTQELGGQQMGHYASSRWSRYGRASVSRFTKKSLTRVSRVRRPFSASNRGWLGNCGHYCIGRDGGAGANRLRARLLVGNTVGFFGNWGSAGAGRGNVPFASPGQGNGRWGCPLWA